MTFFRAAELEARVFNLVTSRAMRNEHTSGIHANHHAVQFYGNDDELLETVGTFLSEGLVAGHPAVVIGTRPHRKAIEAALKSRLIDVERGRRLGDLVLLDAEETLSTFMVDGIPSAAVFNKVIGDVIDQTRRGRELTPVRAYGGMVDVLWKQGKTDAAVRLEVLWNELASIHVFSLLCGYAIGNFYKQTQHYENVCHLHTHVHLSEHKVIPSIRGAWTGPPKAARTRGSASTAAHGRRGRGPTS